MLDGWPYGAAEDRKEAATAHASAGILKWAVSQRDFAVAPIRDLERGLLFAGDVRLYNRLELAELLRIESHERRSDLELAWLAYVRWGEEAVSRLVGDFAFAVWSEHRRELFAARDHFGVRPLYYCREGGRLLLASDVSQIVGLLGTRARVEPRALLERFVPPVRTAGLTYYRDVHALPGGYSLVMRSGVFRQRRYWLPSARAVEGMTYEDHCEGIRQVFFEAVRSRLDSDRPVIVHSSGGFDSCAILITASWMYADGHRGPDLLMASAMTPGMPCDDSIYMDAIAKIVPFDGVRWSALDPCLDDIDDPIVGYPGLRHGVGGGPAQEGSIAQSRGAGVLLTGVLGDSILFSYGVERDMFRAGLWRALIREAFPARRLRASLRFVARATTGYLPPHVALSLLDEYDVRLREPTPPWMGPDLLAVWPPRRQSLDVSASLGSHLATEFWGRLASAATASLIDGTSIHGMRHNIEVRMPYADVRLFEKVLAVPWRDRIPYRDRRRLGRDALGSLLPSEFARRKDQGPWRPVWVLHAQRMLPRLEAFLSDGEWLSEPFVMAQPTREMLEMVRKAKEPDPKAIILLSEFALVEAWLRTSRRRLRMPFTD